MNILQVVTIEEHEASVRIAMANAQRVAVETFILMLKWRCKSCGMPPEEVDRYEAFDGLLAAFEKHLTSKGAGR